MAQSRSKRNYQREYANYQGKPEQIKNRAARNAARREYEKAHGNLPSSVDVDHRKPIAKGGTNAPSNLRARPSSRNRSFARTRNAGMK
jgi:hypothetical protein